MLWADGGLNVCWWCSLLADGLALDTAPREEVMEFGLYFR